MGMGYRWSSVGEFRVWSRVPGESILPCVANIAANLSHEKIPQSIVFSAILFFMSAIPSLPVNVYGIFVLEEKHGFNKTTPALFVTDLLKGWLVAFVIGAPFLSTFLFVVRWAGDRFVPWLMGFL